MEARDRGQENPWSSIGECTRTRTGRSTKTATTPVNRNVVDGRGLTDPALAVDERDDPAHGHLRRKACAAPPGARTFRRGTGPASRHGRSDAERGPRALYRHVPPRNISATFRRGTRPH